MNIQKIWLIGDVHGDSQNALYKFTQNNDVDIALQLGDFGFIWTHGDVTQNKFLNKFERRYPQKKLLTILGNHENYEEIVKFPIVKIYGAKAYQIRKNVFALLRGEILCISNTNILCIGGADSTDKAWRLNAMKNDKYGRKYWWKEERITLSDINNALENAKNKDIDYICSHEAPLNVAYKFFPHKQYNKIDLYSSAYLLEEIFYKIDYKKTWFCGHYHCSEKCVTDWQKEKTFQILDIDEIKEINIY